MSLLALDLGSTNLKGAIFSSDLHLLSQASLPVPYAPWQDPIVEIDPNVFWDLCIDLLRQLLQSSGLSFSSIDHVAISSQAQTFVLLDRSLQPLTPFISWIDRRGAENAALLSQAIGPGFHQHCSFPASVPELQLSKLYYLAQSQPDLLERTFLAASLPSWLSLRLGGPPVLDRNLAAMSGLYSLQSGGWHTPALHLCGLQAEQLPLLVDCGAAISLHPPPDFLTSLAPEGADRQKNAITLHSCGNDQTCGALSAGLQPGEVLLTLGTALVAFRLAGDAIGPYSPAGCWGPYPAGGYYELAVCSQGASALDWALRAFFPDSTPVDLASLAASAGILAVPAFPFFYPQAMGAPQAFTGLAEPAALAFSIYEGLSFSLRDLLENQLRVQPHRLVASGGGSQSDFWLQLIANVTGIPVQRCSGLGGSPLLGAAIQVAPRHLVAAQRSEIFNPLPTSFAPFSKRFQQWQSSQPHKPKE